MEEDQRIEQIEQIEQELIEEENLSNSQELLEPSSPLIPPAIEPISSNSYMDRPMTEVEPAPLLSVIDEAEQILDNSVTLDEEEILDLKIFHWNIENWSQLEDRTLGPIMEAGGHNWNILLFPKGNNQVEMTSIYLDLTEAKNGSNEYACAQFGIFLSKPSDPREYVPHAAQHRFTSSESDWGFTRFKDRLQVQNTLLEDDCIRLTTIIRVVKDPNGILWHNFINYDSKQVTGYVGLQNQGATCYMNSLFQSLYFTNSFRRAVYQIPTENDEPTKSVALALQRVFYNLQFMNQAIGTTELTKSFGWDSLEAFRQHDVQEFNRVLQDNLEIKMKGTPADGAIKNLFVGKMKSYIKCINVDYESSRSEEYYDIQINVKGCKNLEDSFKDYITEETLEGDNKYMAEGHGLQDAKKGVIFESFPPVLHLQLKRFEFDMMREMMVKINDRHEFPTDIDLEPYLSENADKSKSHKYILHGVLVHSGDLNGGHYFAFVKPEKEGKWFKFDDDRVIPCGLKEVLEENFGGEQQGLSRPRLNARTMNRFTNAYMLVYIRECLLDEILAPVTEQDIPHHIALRIERETLLREKKRKEKEEQHLYMGVVIATDDTFKANTGVDFVNFDKKEDFIMDRVRKDETFGEFKAKLNEKLGLNNAFRLWLMVNRQNKTIRVDIPIPDIENDTLLDDVRKRYAATQPSLRLYLERAQSNSNGDPPTFPDSESYLIFIKLFRPELQRVEGVFSLYVEKNTKISDLVDMLKEQTGIEKERDIFIYEEIKRTMIDRVDINLTFVKAELQHGDILCVQKALTAEEEAAIHELGGFTTVDKHLMYEWDKVQVILNPFNEDQGSTELKLTLNKQMTAENIMERVAKELGVDANKLRFWQDTNFKAATPLNNDDLVGLLKSTPPNAAGHHILYEKLQVSLKEIESKCNVTVILCHPTLKDIDQMDLLVSKESDLDAFKEDLIAAGAPAELANGPIRVWDGTYGKFYEQYDDVTWRKIISNSTRFKVNVELIPQEELEMQETDKLITVFHFHRNLYDTHSIPFKFVIKENEAWNETKKRLQARTGLDDKEWNKVKVCIVPADDKSGKTIKDDDEDLLSSHQYSSGDMIGLDHIDKSAKSAKTDAISIRG